MVTPLPSAGNAPQPSVRLNITDPEKNNSAQSPPSRIQFRKRIRLPYAINAVLCLIGKALIERLIIKGNSLENSFFNVVYYNHKILIYSVISSGGSTDPGRCLCRTIDCRTVD